MLKRILAVLLCIVFCVLSFSAGFTAFAASDAEGYGLSAFTADLVKLVRTYDQGNSFISDEYIEDVVGDEADADSLEDHLPLLFEMQDGGIGVFSDGITIVRLQNKSAQLQVQTPESAYTVTADSEARFENGEYIVPATEVLEAFGYTVEPAAKNGAVVYNAFQSKRLIVKATKQIDLQGATQCVSGYKNLYILQYETENAARNAYQYYLTCPEVVYAEPDYIRVMQAEAENLSLLPDKDAGSLLYPVREQAQSWVSEQIGFEDIKLELAERVLPEIVVAVLDSGVDTDHELLAGRLLENHFNLSTTGDPNSCEDDYGHGTHVTGILADNTLGNVKIKPYKVLNNQGKGPSSLIAIAVDSAVADGADIINMSLSGPGESQTMTDSVNAAVEKGVHVVASAGNGKADLSKVYYSPACVESAVTVSAVSQQNTLSAYSNYNNTIDIAAPGDNIKSSYLNNTYTLMSGTSMAAPLVSAGLAIIRSVYPNKTAAEAEQMLMDYAVKVVENEGENCFGNGILYLKYILSIQPKTADPIFSVEGGEFHESFSLTLTSPEKDTIILYILNSESDFPDIGILNGQQYKEPLTISTDTKVSAVAISKGKLPSGVVTQKYTRSTGSPEDLFDIDKNGKITAYVGTQTEVTVPSSIRGTAVTGIGMRAFKDNTTLQSITLPDTAVSVDFEAFSGCTALHSVTGAGLKTVGMSAFQNSAIAKFPFVQIESFGIKAFSGCNNLQNVVLDAAKSIEISAFENADGLTQLHSDTVLTVGMYAFRGTSLESVSLPNATSVSASAFENCADLREVSMPRLKTVTNALFKNCIALRTVELPSVTKIATEAFCNTALAQANFQNVTEIGKSAFSGCAALKYAFFPQVQSAQANAFAFCRALTLVYLPSLTTVQKEMFADCTSLKALSLPSVITVFSGAFDRSYVEFLQLDSAVMVLSLPQTLTDLVLPAATSGISAILPQNAFTVYGNIGTYAETFANDTENAAFCAVPALLFDLPQKITADTEYISAYAVGFHCTYQWYKNDTVSNTGGTPIEGATRFYYQPNLADDAASYYCVVESRDGEFVQSMTSAPVENHPKFRQADFTAYNEALEIAAAIDRTQYTAESLAVLDAAIAVDTSSYTLEQQALLDAQTETIFTAIASLRLNFHIGDVNKDNKVNAVDARWILQSASGARELEGNAALLADVNGDGKVNAIDARWVLQIASGARTRGVSES